MASHEELLAELPKLEKLSHAARLKRAKKRREEQLKKYKATLSSMIKRDKTPANIQFELNAVLHDVVTRNDVKNGKEAASKGLTTVLSVCSALCPKEALKSWPREPPPPPPPPPTVKFCE